MEEKRKIVWESVVSDGKTESRMNFYADRHITLHAGKITFDSDQE